MLWSTFSVMRCDLKYSMNEATSTENVAKLNKWF